MLTFYLLILVLLVVTDAVLRVMLQMAGDLRSKQSFYKITPLVAISQWVGVVISILLLSFLMHAYIHNLLASHGVGCISFMIMGTFGAIGMTLVVHTIVTRGNYLALEANLAELKTVLRVIGNVGSRNSSTL